MINGDKERLAYYAEDEIGVYTGYVLEAEVDLLKPIEVGNRHGIAETLYVTVTQTELEIETKAGKFKHVIELEWDDGGLLYFAPNVGRIKEVDKNGKVVVELIEMKKR